MLIFSVYLSAIGACFEAGNILLRFGEDTDEIGRACGTHRSRREMHTGFW
jgi:hypothetical protein